MMDPKVARALEKDPELVEISEKWFKKNKPTAREWRAFLEGLVAGRDLGRI